MPYKEPDISKMYWSIGEVADMFGVATSLIRYWETEFDILKPKKNKKGNRLFRKEDIQNLKLIYHLVKERGYTLDGAKKKLKDGKDDAANNLEIVDRLNKLRAFLVDLKEQL